MQQRFNPHKQRKQTSGMPTPETTRAVIHAITSIPPLVKEQPQEPVYASKPLKNGFLSLNLSERLTRNITEKGYSTPTPIQEQGIPAVLTGRDVIGIANTGTGKTAAFLIPLIEMMSHNSSLHALIVTPTRELAVQIFEEFELFARDMDMHAALCIGGASLRRQKDQIAARPQFVIGTPGRLKDLIGERSLYLRDYNIVVLDEADRMVDIGFIHDIKYFITLLPRERQSLFFSATISKKVKEVLESFVHNPITVSVKKVETLDNIAQDVIHVEPGYKKIDKLHDVLVGDGFDKVLIFGRTKWGIENLTIELQKRGFKVGSIHGNKRQNQRQRTLDQFKRGEIQILLATDVASRGLDIPDVTHVINYDMPQSMEDYVHRIGRTGRANKQGVALTFVD